MQELTVYSLMALSNDIGLQTSLCPHMCSLVFIYWKHISGVQPLILPYTFAQDPQSVDIYHTPADIVFLSSIIHASTKLGYHNSDHCCSYLLTLISFWFHGIMKSPALCYCSAISYQRQLCRWHNPVINNSQCLSIALN